MAHAAGGAPAPGRTGPIGPTGSIEPTGPTTGPTGPTGSRVVARAQASGAVRWSVATAAGVLVGVVGTVLHRSTPPWGMVLCLALVVSSTVLVRAWAGLLPVVGYAVGWLVVVQAMSLSGPGGDVLVPAGDWLGYGWGLGGMVAIGVACFGPSRWFSDVRPTA